jgi:hypothetical protein
MSQGLHGVFPPLGHFQKHCRHAVAEMVDGMADWGSFTQADDRRHSQNHLVAALQKPMQAEESVLCCGR